MHTHKTNTSSPTVAKPSASSRDEDWINVGDDDMFAVGPGSTSEWQRMCAMREREQLSQCPQPSSERATTFSQLFSQLKREWKVLVQGVKGGILRRSKSRDQGTRYQDMQEYTCTFVHTIRGCGLRSCNRLSLGHTKLISCLLRHDYFSTMTSCLGSTTL